VALAWFRLFGFASVKDSYLGHVSLWDWRLWLVFAIHDLGYWGLPNMDGEEGELHPEWAAYKLRRWLWKLDPRHNSPIMLERLRCVRDVEKWAKFCQYHSRFLSKADGQPYSMLCVADKLAVALEPWWLYLPRVIATGEIEEYMALADARTEAGEPKYATMNVYSSVRREWFDNVCEYLRRWVEEHKDGRQDTWTPEMRTAKDSTGCWQ